jgi:RNA polymerase sigma-70 factor (ECF subfamily)
MTWTASALGDGLPRQFPTTRWTLVLSLREAEPARRAALAELLPLYWKPLYVFARRKGLASERAEDAVQGFFAHLLGRPSIVVDRDRGRFRSYLRGALAHYLVNLHESDAALKRGGGLRMVELDAAEGESDLVLAPAAADDAFDREWALAVVERALARLRAEYADGRRRGDAETVFRFFEAVAPPSYAEAAARCGMNVPQFKMALHRARARLRELVRDEVAETTAEGADVEAEMQELVRLLSAAP